MHKEHNYNSLRCMINHDHYIFGKECTKIIFLHLHKLNTWEGLQPIQINKIINVYQCMASTHDHKSCSENELSQFRTGGSGFWFVQ